MNKATIKNSIKGRNIGNYMTHYIANELELTRHDFIDVNISDAIIDAHVERGRKYIEMTEQADALLDASRRAKSTMYADGASDTYYKKAYRHDKTVYEYEDVNIGLGIDIEYDADGIGHIVDRDIEKWEFKDDVRFDDYDAPYMDIDVSDVPYEKASVHSLDDVVKQDVDVMLAKYLVKRMSSGKKTWETAPCMDIVFSGFKQTIFDDIVSSVRECLFMMYSDGLLHFEDVDGIGRMVYDTEIITKKDGTEVEKSAFLRLFKAVRLELSAYSNHRRTADGKGIIVNSYDAIKYDDNGNVDRGIMAYRKDGRMSSGYLDAVQTCLELQDVENRADVIAFWEYVSVKHNQGYDNALKVFRYLVLGYKQDEIATLTHRKQSAVARTIQNMRSWYQEYKKTDAYTAPMLKNKRVKNSVMPCVRPSVIDAPVCVYHNKQYLDLSAIFNA